ncbi:plasmid recombination protein [Aureimonas sp. N4]|uniref:plasmid recombination protein n=1 Tax=Aureimonas sp. N4 TaxID=1638165 RepID=UPI0012E371EF|nr:plasmid recombination protein [Aureimonas sp. N4]
MAYQFVHLEVFSRKGRDGRGTAFVFDEAARKLDACAHVTAPQPPEVVHGVDIDRVRLLHDEQAAAARTVPVGGKARAIRKDQNTLLTVVASHPAQMSDVRCQPSTATDVAAWEARTVAWLRDLYGDALLSVVRHVDESHPHLHAFIVPSDPELRAARLHPGSEAKRRATAEAAAGDGAAANKAGDRAYRQAMREWQDSYWHFVGLPSGLARLGPGRRRLTRAAWQAEQTAAAALKTARELGTAEGRAADAKAVAIVSGAVTKANQIGRKASEIISDTRRHQASAAAALRATKEAEDRSVQRVRNAQQEANAISIRAAEEARRIGSFGSRIRSLWDGLRRSSIWSAVRREAQTEVSAVRAEATDLARRLVLEVKARRSAEARAEAASDAVRLVALERDTARRTIAAMVPGVPRDDPRQAPSMGRRK